MRGVKEYLSIVLPSAATTADGLAGSEWEAGGSRSVTRIIIPGSGLQEKPVMTVVIPPCCSTLRSDERVTLAEVTILCIRCLNLMARAAERRTRENVAKKNVGSPARIAAAPRKDVMTQIP
jgi:hypothetical protein